VAIVMPLAIYIKQNGKFCLAKALMKTIYFDSVVQATHVCFGVVFGFLEIMLQSSKTLKYK